METVRKGKGEKEEIVLEKEGDTKREAGVSHLLCGLRATREQTITALSLFSISLYLFPSLSDLPFFSWSYSTGEFRQLVYAAALRLNRITKEASNLSTVTVYTRRTVMSGAWKRNSTSYETGLI